MIFEFLYSDQSHVVAPFYCILLCIIVLSNYILINLSAAKKSLIPCVNMLTVPYNYYSTELTSFCLYIFYSLHPMFLVHLILSKSHNKNF